MKDNVREYIFSCLQRRLPFLISLFFIFLEHIFIDFDAIPIKPMLGLICVFFWIFNRPDIFNLFSVAVLGIFSDLLNATPFGIYLLSYIFLYIMEMKIAKYISNKMFAFSFASFGVLSLIVICGQWLLLCIYYGNILPFFNAFTTWMITVSLYPLMADINIRLAKIILPEEDF